jgi:hypothetical protein
MSQENPVSIGRLVLISGLITLGVTVLRLVGELQHWPKVWFHPEPGGGFAPIGIVCLPIVFGIYFALKPAGAGRDHRARPMLEGATQKQRFADIPMRGSRRPSYSGARRGDVARRSLRLGVSGNGIPRRVSI